MTRQGYTCITFSTGADSKRKAQYIEILEQRRVEGAIFIGSMFGTEAVRQSVEQHLSNTPVVIVNGALDLPNTYSVLIDEERGTEECVALLTQKGRKQLAYLMDVATPANEKKNRGFCTACSAAGWNLPGTPSMPKWTAPPAPAVRWSGAGAKRQNCSNRCRM